MKLNIKLLKEISETPGTSGFEQRIREVVLRELKGHVDSVEIDNMGNIIALKKGKSHAKKVMSAAHLDEIGFMVKHIDDEGFIRFHTLGGFDAKTLSSQRVIIHGKKSLVGVMGSKPIHVMTDDERNKAPKTTDYFIDLGLSKKEVIKFISVGNPITRDQDLIEMGNNVSGKSLDNRISVFILIEALKLLKKPAYDFYAVFTVQEEVGIRGAQVATLKIQPDFAIALDTTIAFDVPGARADEVVTKLGEGTAVKIMDSSVICDYRMVTFLKETADKNKIKWQSEILTAGGTDTSNLQRMTPGGSIAGAISIPTRHIHQTVEMVNKDDVIGSIQLLNCALEGLDKGKWGF